MKTLSRPFLFMLVAILVAGLWAGARVGPALLIVTPLYAALIAHAGLQAQQRAQLGSAAGLEHLPNATRLAVTGALAELPPGAARDALLSISRVGSEALRHLPGQYRVGDYGARVTQLVEASAGTALHTHTLATTLGELRAQHDTLAAASPLEASLARLQHEHDARVQQLAAALNVLSQIGPDVGDPDDTGTLAIIRILEELKREAVAHEGAEQEIASLLGRGGR